MTQEQQQEIRRLRAMGEGYKRIGVILNLSVNTVKSFCRRDREEDKLPIEDQQDDCVVCLRCGQPLVLIPGRKRRLFCSDACRVAYWRTQAKPKEQPRRCLNCGRLLLGNNSRRKYCDHACYIEHRFGEGGEKHEGEKYKGDALLQKTFTVDFLQKKKKANEGEVPQYYVENSHPAIVTEEVFDLVQHELRRRQHKGRHTSAASIFSNRIVCGECGAYYGSKVWHSTDAYRSRIWRCNRKYETKGSPCPSPHLREAELQDAFLKAINQVIQKKEEIIEACSQALRTLNDTTSLEQKAARLQAEQDAVNDRIERLIRENAQVAQDQQEYKLRIEALYARCDELKSSMAKVRSQIMDRAGRSRNVEAYLQRISRTEPLTVFDESVFAGTVDCVTVCKGQGKNDRQMVFRFKDGTEIPMTI